MAIERLSAYIGDSLTLVAAAAIAATLGHRAYQKLSPESQAQFKKTLPYAAAIGTLYTGVVLYRAFNVAPAPQEKPLPNHVLDTIWDKIEEAANCYQFSYHRTISYPFCSLECAKYHEAAGAVGELGTLLIGFGVSPR